MVPYATLTPDSPRRRAWIEAFGTDRVPLVSHVSTMTLLPGHDRPEHCYRVSLDRMGDDGLRGLGIHLAERFGLDDWKAAVDLVRGPHGLPILAGPDMIVTIESTVHL